MGVIALGAAAVLTVPGLRDGIANVITDLRLRFVPEMVDIDPVSTTGAGVSNPNSGAMAGDHDTGTFWLAPSDSGAPSLTVNFKDPFDLGGIVMHSGATTEGDFTLHRRPEIIELTFPGTQLEPLVVTLEDTPNPQALTLDARNIKQIVIRVTKLFPASAGGDQFLAIREIEFKARK